MPIDNKISYADYIIDNSGTIDETYKEVHIVWEELMKSQSIK